MGPCLILYFFVAQLPIWFSVLQDQALVPCFIVLQIPMVLVLNLPYWVTTVGSGLSNITSLAVTILSGLDSRVPLIELLHKDLILSFTLLVVLIFNYSVQRTYVDNFIFKQRLEDAHIAIIEQSTLDAKREYVVQILNDMGTPLMALCLSNESLIELSYLSRDVNDIATTNRTALDMIERLRDSVLDATKYSYGKPLTPQMEKVDIQNGIMKPCRNLMTGFNSTDFNSKVTMTFIIDDGVPKLIKSDPRFLLSMLCAYISNAKKFTDHGLIETRIWYNTNSGQLFFEVSDDGMGVNAENAHLLFTPFAEFHRGGGGTGLGLFSVKHRAEALGGEVGYINRAEKKNGGSPGSLFWFSIPFIPPATASADENSSESNWSKTSVDEPAETKALQQPSQTRKQKYNIQKDKTPKHSDTQGNWKGFKGRLAKVTPSLDLHALEFPDDEKTDSGPRVHENSPTNANDPADGPDGEKRIPHRFMRTLLSAPRLEGDIRTMTFNNSRLPSPIKRKQPRSPKGSPKAVTEVKVKSAKSSHFSSPTLDTFRENTSIQQSSLLKTSLRGSFSVKSAFFNAEVTENRPRTSSAYGTSSAPPETKRRLSSSFISFGTHNRPDVDVPKLQLTVTSMDQVSSPIFETSTDRNPQQAGSLLSRPLQTARQQLTGRSLTGRLTGRPPLIPSSRQGEPALDQIEEKASLEQPPVSPAVSLLKKKSSRRLTARKYGIEKWSDEPKPMCSSNCKIKTVLVIEDEYIISKMICKLLRKAGYEVEHAENGAIGLEMMKYQPYCYVLSDLTMPVMDGFTAICLFREWEKLARSGDCQRQHICAISANSDELTKAKAFDSGFDNFLSKPTNIKVIIREIEKLHGEKEEKVRLFLS